MGNGAGRTTEERQLAPALRGGERADSDPPVMEQWINEIHQATSYLETQMSRVRAHTDSIFGPEPRTEGEDGADKMAEVRPQFDVMASAINRLHNSTTELSKQLDRLEGHRLV